MKDNNGIIAMDDNMLAYELVNIRYNNCIQVHKVEVFGKYLCISLVVEILKTTPIRYNI